MNFCPRTLLSQNLQWIPIFVILITNIYQVQSRDEDKDKCEICANIIKAFDKGLKKTEKSNFGGGNTDWEERKLGSYADSETRLVEIIEGLCGSSDHGCHSMVEENEEILETWWFKEKSNNKDFKSWLCNEQFKVCCPNGTFGKDCKVCPGGKENPCSGHGECEGAGKRSGSGKCACEPGYEGDECDECEDGYYEEYEKDAKNLSCKACHESCKSSCSGGTAKDCDECDEGWNKSSEGECQDINECEQGERCAEGEYCENNPGSFECNECDKSCLGNCTGPGGKGCLACKEGYLMDSEKGCQDIDECEEAGKCKEDEWCRNKQGSHDCVACNSACKTCVGAGPKECTSCADGYELTGEKGCKDIDECVAETNPCTKKREVCKNTPGGFNCDCKKGYHRKGEQCVKAIDMKKKVKDDDIKDDDEEEEDDDIDEPDETNTKDEL